MFKKSPLLVLVLALALCACLPAQVLLEKRYGINLDNYQSPGRGAPAPDGGLVLCGNIEKDKEYEICVRKIDASGAEVWYKRYGQVGTGNVTAIIPDKHGGYLVSGYVLNQQNGSYDALLLRLDGSGNLLWRRTFGDTGTDFGLSLCQLINDDIVLCGSTLLSTGEAAYFQAVFNSTGHLITSYVHPANDIVTEIRSIPTVDGGYLLVLNTGTFDNIKQIVKYTAGHQEHWTELLTGNTMLAGSAITSLFDLKATAEGVLFCVNTNNGVQLLHLSNTKTLIWKKLVRSGYTQSAGIQPLADGTIAMVAHPMPFFYKKLAADGTTLDSVGSTDLPLQVQVAYIFGADGNVYLSNDFSYTVGKLSISGVPEIAWQRISDIPGSHEDETGDVIAATPEGGFILAGSRQEKSGQHKLWVFKADPDGAIIWEKTYSISFDASDRPIPGSVELDEKGNIILFVATDNNNPRYFLLKLSPDGELVFNNIISVSDYLAGAFRAYPLPGGGFIACVTTSYDDAFANLIRLNDEGNIVWAQSYAQAACHDLALLPNGHFIGAGTQNERPWIFRVDGAGNMLWEQRYPLASASGLSSIALTSDGFLGAVGFVTTNSWATSEALVLKVDVTDGALIWQKSFSKGDNTYWSGKAAIPGPSGAIYFTGVFFAPPFNIDPVYTLVRLRAGLSTVDAAGNLIADQTFGHDAMQLSQPNADLAPDGNLFLCATLNSGTSLQDAWVAKVYAKTVSSKGYTFTGDFSISPNPASGHTRLSLTTPYTGPVQVHLFDTDGREVMTFHDEKRADQWNFDLPLGGLKAGVYWVNLTMGGKQVAQAVIVPD